MKMLLHAVLIFAGMTAAAETVSRPALEDTASVRYRLNPILVTATKIPMPQSQLAASVSVIDGAALSESPSSAALDAVENQVPGLYLTEWGVMGYGVAGSSAGKLSIRGVGGDANTCVLILRNGRPDFMGLMGCTLADEYSSDGVERIEVLRGPGSFLYGTNALGGVINIIPKRMSSDGFSTHFSAGGGSFDSGILSLAQGGKIGRFDYYVTAGTRRTDGHREDGNDYYRGNHYTLHAGYEISPSLDLEFNGNLANLRMFDPGPVTAPAQNNWYNVKRGGSDLNLTAKTSYGETNVKLHTNMGYHDFYDDWHSWDRTTGLMIYHNASLWTGNSMTAGFDWINYGGHASDASGSYTPRYITETAPYLHMQQIFWGRLIASAGLRLEHHELYGNETLPKAGLVVQLSERTSFRVSASKGFRSPSIRELYFWMPANAELTPDRLWNKEVGLSHEFGNTMRVEADVFQVKGSNLIQFTAPPPKWMNGGSYTNTGYEVLWTWTPLPRLETGATWSDMKLDDAVFNAPGKKLTAYLRTKIGPVGLYASLLSIADWKGIDASSNLHDMPDYTVVNVSATAAVYHGMGVKLVVRNLFDASYQAMYGYPMPGRIFSTELDYGF